MRILYLLITSALLALTGVYSSSTFAADDAVKVTSIAQTEIEITDKKGRKTLKRVPVDKAIPGTEVIFTTVFENLIDKSANDITINNPIPPETEYKAGSAFGKDCEILFSIDGKIFGHAEDLKVKGDDNQERIALPREYTHIRWNYKVPLAKGKPGEVGFRATIK